MRYELENEAFQAFSSPFSNFPQKIMYFYVPLKLQGMYSILKKE